MIEILKKPCAKMLSFLFIGFTLLINFPTTSYAETEVYLGLKKTGFEKIGIAVLDLKEKIAGQKVEYISKNGTNILNNDLRLSGIFSPVENKLFIKEVQLIDRKEGKIVFAEWTRIGAQALVKGEYLFEKGRLVIDLKLYDAYEGKLLLSKRYKTRVKGLRMVMHTFCDEIVHLVTGKKGIAQTKIAFSSRYRGKKEIYVSDYDGYNLRRLTREKSIALSPDWSPDGKLLAFTTWRHGNPDVYAVKLKSGVRRPISTVKGLNTAPAWSPDGKYMALTLSKDQNSEIYIMKLAGKKLTRVTHSRAIDTSPTWSPDGKKIAFTSDRSGKPQIYTIQTNGTGIKRLTYSTKECQSPDWSPKGDTIAYSCRQSSHFDIYIFDVSKKNQIRLTNNGRNNENPSWSPDGRHIAFESIGRGKHNIYIMSAKGKNQHKLLKLKNGGYNPSWSPRFDQTP